MVDLKIGKSVPGMPLFHPSLHRMQEEKQTIDINRPGFIGAAGFWSPSGPQDLTQGFLTEIQRVDKFRATWINPLANCIPFLGGWCSHRVCSETPDVLLVTKNRLKKQRTLRPHEVHKKQKH